MTVRDPTTFLRTEPSKVTLEGFQQLLAGLYTFTTGNEYLTLGAALQITTSPAGTPAANTLYKDNIICAWVIWDANGNILASFNVSSVTHPGNGRYVVTWNRDFASTSYAIFPSADSSGSTGKFVNFTSKVVGSFECQIANTAGTPENRIGCAWAIGAQA